MRTVADVVVIGAGVVGCSVAFHLARLRGARVIVVEKGSIGSGMTKRSSGVIRTHYAVEAEARLALNSLRYFQDWSEIVGGDCGFVQTGLAIVVQGGAPAVRLENEVEMLFGIGVNTRLISPEEWHTLEPAARVDDITLLAYEPESGYVDTMNVTRSLASRAREMGTVFQTGTLVKSILVDRGRVTGVDTNRGTIEALDVVLAAGPWSERLLKPFGVEMGIRPERTQVAVFERPPESKAAHAGYLDWVTSAYFRPHAYGLTLGGMTSGDTEQRPNPDQFDETVDPQFIRRVHDAIGIRLPGLSSARYVRGHAGIYDMSPDAHPIVDRIPGVHGLVVAAGLSGNGSAFAPALGACIAELVTEGAASTVDMHPFRLSRFEDQGQA